MSFVSVKINFEFNPISFKVGKKLKVSYNISSVWF